MWKVQIWSVLYSQRQSQGSCRSCAWCKAWSCCPVGAGLCVWSSLITGTWGRVSKLPCPTLLLPQTRCTSRVSLFPSKRRFQERSCLLFFFQLLFLNETRSWLFNFGWVNPVLLSHERWIFMVFFFWCVCMWPSYCFLLLATPACPSQTMLRGSSFFLLQRRSRVTDQSLEQKWKYCSVECRKQWRPQPAQAAAENLWVYLMVVCTLLPFSPSSSLWPKADSAVTIWSPRLLNWVSQFPGSRHNESCLLYIYFSAF